MKTYYAIETIEYGMVYVSKKEFDDIRDRFSGEYGSNFTVNTEGEDVELIISKDVFPNETIIKARVNVPSRAIEPKGQLNFIQNTKTGEYWNESKKSWTIEIGYATIYDSKECLAFKNLPKNVRHVSYSIK